MHRSRDNKKYIDSDVIVKYEYICIKTSAHIEGFQSKAKFLVEVNTGRKVVALRIKP